MSPRRPNLSPLYHMPRKMKQDYFVVYSRILMGSGFAVRGFLGAQRGARVSEARCGAGVMEKRVLVGAPETDYGKKARNFPK